MTENRFLIHMLRIGFDGGKKNARRKQSQVLVHSIKKPTQNWIFQKSTKKDDFNNVPWHAFKIVDMKLWQLAWQIAILLRVSE